MFFGTRSRSATAVLGITLGLGLLAPISAQTFASAAMPATPDGTGPHVTEPSTPTPLGDVRAQPVPSEGEEAAMAARAATLPEYTIVDRSGGHAGFAAEVNEAGVVAGTIFPDGTANAGRHARPVVWVNGVRHALDAGSAASPIVHAGALGDDGTVGGWEFDVATRTRYAVRWVRDEDGVYGPKERISPVEHDSLDSTGGEVQTITPDGALHVTQPATLVPSGSDMVWEDGTAYQINGIAGQYPHLSTWDMNASRQLAGSLSTGTRMEGAHWPAGARIVVVPDGGDLGRLRRGPALRVLRERRWHPDRMQSVHVWIRSESRGTERRAPVVPADVPLLLDAGFEVTVEESSQRIFAAEEYAAAGASVVGEGAWTDAPHDVHVLGIKELPDEPASLRHRHIYFAHAFKGQEDARRTLERFRRGGGRLLDIEYLTDKDGKRVVAFGYWAGYVGAALGVLHLAGTLAAPLCPMTRHDLDAELEQAGKAGADLLLALVTGARGRSGRGAQRALMTAGVPITRWDRQETRDLHKQALLGHDLLVNCVLTHTPTTPFVEQADLEDERRLRVLADVTCDVTGPTNMLPVNTKITTWHEPVRQLHGGTPQHGAAPLEVIAIDNLPSLLPREASEGFSADLTPHLLGLAEEGGGPSGPWRAAGRAFDQAIGKLQPGYASERTTLRSCERGVSSAGWGGLPALGW